MAKTREVNGKLRHSLTENIRYTYGTAFSCYPIMKWELLTLVLSQLLAPIVATAIPAVAIGIITRDEGTSSYLIGMTGIILLYAILNFVSTYSSNLVQYRNVCARMKGFFLQLIHKAMTADYCNVEPQKQQKRIEKACQALGSNWVGPEFLMKNTPVFLINCLGVVTYGAVITTLDVRILFILIAMAGMNYFLGHYAREYMDRHKDENAAYEQQSHNLKDSCISVVNGKDVRMFQMEKWFHQVFQDLIEKKTNWQSRMEKRWYLQSLSDQCFIALRDVLAYYLLVVKALDGEISVAVFTLYIGVISGFSNWLFETISAFNNMKRASLEIDDMRDVLEMPNVFCHEKGCELPSKEEHPLDIEFRNVSFRYDGDDKDILKNINLKIEGGSKVALVGNNGAGKSTLVKLLCGLYYPTSGEILVGGRSISTYNIDEYHKLIGAVFQEVQTIGFTIAKNLAACKEEDIDYGKVHTCLDLAGLAEKVGGLKKKEKTYLSQVFDQEGINLSGGETQKLMLARAIYKNAPIMVLDEPTAALDPIAESQMYERYHELTTDKTSIFISHRLASTSFCDRVIFLDDGQIVEDGTHESLMRNQGKYAQMFEVQSHYYKERGKEEQYA
ncbi:MAG TPA: ABC transporter ATP-binding protein [Lachnospiraceae bacterium]|nr:ABC transporter ATP-binding protein [Lachnospiraceae bacterium]